MLSGDGLSIMTAIFREGLHPLNREKIRSIILVLMMSVGVFAYVIISKGETDPVSIGIVGGISLFAVVLGIVCGLRMAEPLHKAKLYTKLKRKGAAVALT
jgi:hypothetical protein